MEGVGQSGDRFGGAADNLMAMGQSRLGAFANPSDVNSQSAFDQAYSTATANIEPRMQRATSMMENKLRNQGLDPTSEAYKSQMADLGLQQNEARNDLTSRLQSQMFNQGMQGRQQGFQEATGLYGLGAQAGQTELQAAQGLGGLGRSGMVDAVTDPGVSNYAQVNTAGPVDYAGLNQTAYNQQMNVYNQQMQQRNAMIGGLAGLGGSLLGLPMGGGASLGGNIMGGVMSRFSGGGGGGGGGLATSPMGGGGGLATSPMVNGYPNNDPGGFYR